MDILELIGRILFGALFIGSGIAHVTQVEAMSGYAASKGVPQARLATLASGVLMAIGAVLVILGLWGDLGALLILLFLLSACFLMHPFWKETEPMAKQMEMVQFNKDLALAGAALVLLWMFQAGGVPFTITDGLF